MDKQILSIAFPDETNAVFQKHMAMDQVHLVTCKDMSDAIVLLSRDSFRLIFIDASTQNIEDAQESMAKLRKITYIPVVALTSDDAAAATQEAGADICVPPDMDLHRLFSTGMAQIRRNEYYSRYDDVMSYSPTLFRGDLMIDSARHRVTRNGEEIALLPREFRLLSHFARNPGVILNAEQLGRAIWLSEHNYGRDVTKVVSELRRKLDDDRLPHTYIETIHGVGYRFIPAE